MHDTYNAKKIIDKISIGDTFKKTVPCPELLKEFKTMSNDIRKNIADSVLLDKKDHLTDSILFYNKVNKNGGHLDLLKILNEIDVKEIQTEADTEICNCINNKSDFELLNNTIDKNGDYISDEEIRKANQMLSTKHQICEDNYPYNSSLIVDEEGKCYQKNKQYPRHYYTRGKLRDDVIRICNYINNKKKYLIHKKYTPTHVVLSAKTIHKLKTFIENKLIKDNSRLLELGFQGDGKIHGLSIIIDKTITKLDFVKVVVKLDPNGYNYHPDLSKKYTDIVPLLKKIDKEINDDSNTLKNFQKTLILNSKNINKIYSYVNSATSLCAVYSISQNSIVVQGIPIYVIPEETIEVIKILELY